MECGAGMESAPDFGVVIAVVVFAPATIAALLGFQPGDGLANTGVILGNARGFKTRQH
jgi:hypothetical protein